MIMKQEDKELLLRDICARLPYWVKCIVKSDGYVGVISSIESQYGVVTFDDGRQEEICDIKPYLYPLSSMTEEQKYICPIGVGNLETFIEKESWAYLELSFDSILRFIDWLNKNHFDYRGLIPMGLAIDATGLNIY